MQSVEDAFHNLACTQPPEQCEGVAVQRTVAGQGLRPLIKELFEVLHADTVKKFYRVWQASKNKVVTYQTYCAGTDRLIVQTCRVQTYYHRLLQILPEDAITLELKFHIDDCMWKGQIDEITAELEHNKRQEIIRIIMYVSYTNVGDKLLE